MSVLFHDEKVSPIDRWAIDRVLRDVISGPFFLSVVCWGLTRSNMPAERAIFFRRFWGLWWVCGVRRLRIRMVKSRWTRVIPKELRSKDSGRGVPRWNTEVSTAAWKFSTIFSSEMIFPAVVGPRLARSSSILRSPTKGERSRRSGSSWKSSKREAAAVSEWKTETTRLENW